MKTTSINTKRLLLLQSLGILHCVEEYFFGFSIWATTHFGTTTQTWYLLSHLFLAIILAVIAIYVFRGYKVGIYWAWVVQTLLVTNGLFHIFTTILWREYSPGIISQLVVIPITYLFVKTIRKANILSANEMVTASLLGTVISVLILLTLIIDVPV